MSLPAAVWDYVADGLGPTAERVRDAVSDQQPLLGAAGIAQRRYELSSAVLGAGPLEPLLADPEVTDVLVCGTAGVWVDRGEGLVRVDCDLGDHAQVRRLAVRLAGSSGRRLDEASAFVEGVLPGGVRLHAVLPPLAEQVQISLRVPRRVVPTLSELAGRGMFSQDGLALLRAVVAARLSFVVTGGTGTGKTTLLAALLAEVPPDQRIVVVEDVRELAVDHPHVVRLQCRPANVEGVGGIGLVAMVRQSLRMRPDRLVVGEVRGAEVRELLAALNTGHDGGCGTLHANAPADVVARFEALGALAGLAPAAVAAQLVSAVRVVLHLRRRDGVRHLSEVAVIQRLPDGSAGMVLALSAAPGMRPTPGPAWPMLRDDLGAHLARAGS
ncbi:MAG TPA: TadA family conjugal transfer-associated ATPase [Dermatophilaceae bacterium]|nr:TadA family conjugal transfer-associated ATPase [Dermatophilaceae bacterium]